MADTPPSLPLDLAPLEGHNRVAVAVSGGADSLALLHALSHQTTHVILALIVDHGLRAESAAEAEATAHLVAQWPRVEARVLRREGAKPSSGRQEAARQARYDLLAAACLDAGITILATGHHADDQLETWLMRVAKGSGPDGLVCMPRLQERQGLVIWRPCLPLTHADLVAYCTAHGIGWIEDPSNRNEAYLRARLRPLLETLRTEGLTPQRLDRLQASLARQSDALAHMTRMALDACVLEHSDDHVCLDMAALSCEPTEIVLRVLDHWLTRLGSQTAYGPRLEALETLCAQLASATRSQKFTLAGCVLALQRREQRLTIRKEPQKTCL